MRILHTSDWHLGRSLRGADLTPAFTQWCDYLVQLVKDEKIDAVLIAGDIYDRGVPPVLMVELLSQTLHRLLEHTQVVITSGNHDSPGRLGFASELLRAGLYIRTNAAACSQAIPLRNAVGEIGALVYGIPYLDPYLESSRLSTSKEEVARSHSAVVGAALKNIHRSIKNGEYATAPLPRIVMAHAFVTGGESSDSEVDLHIGGVDSVPASIFHLPAINDQEPLNYIALGHLHSPQKITAKQAPLMRYSGSPIAFSFSEEHHKKSSVLLEFAENSPELPPKITLLPSPVYRPLATLQDSYDALLSAKYDSYQEHFLRIYVQDAQRPLNMNANLRRKFPYALEIYHLGAENTAQGENRGNGETAVQKNSGISAPSRASAQEILEEFFLANGAAALAKKEKELLDVLWRKAQQEEQEL
ncbi:metallophosphoesterase family protein [Arcanobacterium urinimassiliense]|uniref:metallophosphoesterase family protein n=1 Tax=Arcanobacterium urinimassiliense TaxID=1871014 RepID=UPI000939D87E|nr:exonuclease subunit SbcD [Arcanobacterium urinimassiliense]